MRRILQLRTLFYFICFVLVLFSTIQIPGILKWYLQETVPVVIKENEVTTTIPEPKPTVLVRKPTKPRKRVIDMVNAYEPYVEFNFVFPEIMPTVEKREDLFLVILVNSGARGERYRKQRDMIRKTWANRQVCEHLMMSQNPKIKHLKWKLVFVLGKSRTDDDKLIAQEAKEHNDMIIGNITDNYLNNINKLYMGQSWASTLHPKFTLKSDDDVYIRIPGVLEYIVNANISGPFYGGVPYIRDRVHRSPGGTWSISKKYYPHEFFPTFHGGAFILLSSDLHTRLFNYVHLRRPFHTDDAYLGVAMNDFKVTATGIPSFVVKHNMPTFLQGFVDKCAIQATVAFGHSLHPGSMSSLHDSLEGMCAKNFTILSCERKTPIQ